ncbi:hypothetical protein WK57_26500 [Burkholderia ubonensis]|uniref:MarR family transcriptional regulator n=1 Tax=Burkholderia ubonensis TaxID=101571 RepID=A0AA40UUF9_9BURK|nr:hypothetical protein WK57_26500 [Burkholderia ubonensis]
MHSIDLLDDDCFALRQASRHISKLYEHHLSAVDITPTQFTILGTLVVSMRSTNDAPQSEVAKRVMCGSAADQRRWVGIFQGSSAS